MNPNEFNPKKHSPPCQYCTKVVSCLAAGIGGKDTSWAKCRAFKPTLETMQTLPKRIIIALLGALLLA